MPKKKKVPKVQKVPTDDDYIIIYFDLTKEIEIVKELPSTPIHNALIVNFAVLKALQPALSKKFIENVALVMMMHNKTRKKINIKDMGQYGKAGFAIAPIKKDDIIIYGSFLTSDELPTTSSNSAYGIESRVLPNFSYEGSYVESEAKYFQHLPSRVSLDFQELQAVTENFIGSEIFIKITLNKTDFVVPFSILYATNDIEIGIVGWDYGDDYWQHRECATLFQQDGTVIPAYNFTNSVSDFSQSRIPQKGYGVLLEHQYLRCDDDAIFIPESSHTLLKKFDREKPKNHGTLSMLFPTLCMILRQDNLYFINRGPSLDVAILATQLIKPNHLLQMVFDSFSRKTYYVLALNKLKNVDVSHFEEINSILMPLLTKPLFTIYRSEFFELMQSEDIINKIQTMKTEAQAEAEKVAQELPVPIFSINKACFFKAKLLPELSAAPAHELPQFTAPYNSY